MFNVDHMTKLKKLVIKFGKKVDEEKCYMGYGDYCFLSTYRCLFFEVTVSHS